MFWIRIHSRTPSAADMSGLGLSLSLSSGAFQQEIIARIFVLTSAELVNWDEDPEGELLGESQPYASPRLGARSPPQRGWSLENWTFGADTEASGVVLEVAESLWKVPLTFRSPKILSLHPFGIQRATGLVRDEETADWNSDKLRPRAESLYVSLLSKYRYVRSVLGHPCSAVVAARDARPALKKHRADSQGHPRLHSPEADRERSPRQSAPA